MENNQSLSIINLNIIFNENIKRHLILMLIGLIFSFYILLKGNLFYVKNLKKNFSLNFTDKDLDKPLSEFYKEVKTYEDLGITKEQWQKCEEVDNRYFEDWNKKIDDFKVQSYGFKNLEDFKRTYILCNIYNSIKHSTMFNDTLLGDFSWRHEKAMRFKNRNEKYIESIKDSNCRNVLDYYMQFSISMLFSIGW